MELKHLRSYVAVVEARSFTKAADILYTSQPTISTHVRNLEEEFEAKLIIRSTKTLELTPKGEALYEYALQMIQQFDRFQKQWNQKDSMLIQIGSSSIPSAYLLPNILASYKKINNQVLYSITQSDTSDIIDMVTRDRVAVGFIGRPITDDKMVCECFYHDKMVVITPDIEPYQSMKKFKKNIFYSQPLILREDGSASQESIDAYFETIGIEHEELNVVAHLNDQESIKNHVRHGLGISIIAETAVKNDQQGLLIFTLPEQSIQREYYIIYQKDNFLTAQTADFIKYTKSLGQCE